jgi:hypothetical protein
VGIHDSRLDAGVLHDEPGYVFVVGSLAVVVGTAQFCAGGFEHAIQVVPQRLFLLIRQLIVGLGEAMDQAQFIYRFLHRLLLFMIQITKLQFSLKNKKPQAFTSGSMMMTLTRPYQVEHTQNIELSYSNQLLI